MTTRTVSAWFWRPLALLIGCGLPLAACDDGGGSGVVDMGADSGTQADGGLNGICETTANCFGGQLCVEGVCDDCLTTAECAIDPWGASGTCLDNRCCAPGTQDCICGAGCADGLTCESDRCVPEPPCPAGSLGCAYDGATCDGELVCMDAQCVEPVEPTCDAEACAAQGRVCADDGIECGLCDAANGHRWWRWHMPRGGR